MVLLCRSIQLLVVHANSPFNHLSHQIKHIISIRYNFHPTVFRQEVNRTHLTIVCNRIIYFIIQKLDDLLLHYLLHRYIKPSLVLNNWFVIRHEMDFRGTGIEGIPMVSAIVQPMVVRTSSILPQRLYLSFT